MVNAVKVCKKVWIFSGGFAETIDQFNSLSIQNAHLLSAVNAQNHNIIPFSSWKIIPFGFRFIRRFLAVPPRYVELSQAFWSDSLREGFAG